MKSIIILGSTLSEMIRNGFTLFVAKREGKEDFVASIMPNDKKEMRNVVAFGKTPEDAVGALESAAYGAKLKATGGN